MDADEIRAARRRIIETYGPWTAHSIHLGDGIYTTDEPYDDTRLRQLVHVVSDITNKPFNMLRVLDLACLEGKNGIEFALQGARVVSLEGRATNLEKARFAKDVLLLSNLELMLQDVRELSRDEHGGFDVVLCLGILYHLDTPDVLSFVERMYEVCDRVAIVDTHISLNGKTPVEWKGKTYFGQHVSEHSPTATPEERAKALWGSLDNERSFFFTRTSLCNLLRDVGFTSVYECRSPSWLWYSEDPAAEGEIETSRDRVQLVAIKGTPHPLMASPQMNATDELRMPEHPRFFVPPKDFLPGKEPRK